MKIQLYMSPEKSGAHSIIRKLDGVYTLLSPVEIAFPRRRLTTEELGEYYMTYPGRECNQDWAETLNKSALLWTDSGAHNRLFYGIPDEVELYPGEDDEDDEKPLTIASICHTYGLTQADLIDKFDIPRRTVQDWFSGRSVPPRYIPAMIGKILRYEQA